MDTRPSKAVAVWLAVVTGMVFSLVVLGGVTRLTRSGLSIVVWEPIAGAIPPLSEAAWQEEFAAYRLSPEGRIVNSAMDLEGFKRIFLVEYLHRLLGRTVGLAFFLPLALFAWRKQISKRLTLQLGGILTLGGVQGFFGWLMVKSGLQDVPHVSAHRLVLHLSTGLVIFGLLLWATQDAFERRPSRRPAPLWKLAAAVAALSWVVAVFGGYVAGIRAGHAFNTFPHMDGAWIPSGLWEGTPWYSNLYDNVMTVQFVHRWLAKGLFLGVAGLWFATRLGRADGASKLAADGLLAVTALQVSLGIVTLLTHVPVWLGAVHQGGGLLVLAMALVTTYRLRAAVRVDAAASPAQVPAGSPQGVAAA